MANTNKGAFWISEDKEIRNPYYGKQMMTCGSETVKGNLPIYIKSREFVLGYFIQINCTRS